MVKLSEFIGEIVSELTQARACADSTSVQLSQTYHADSFLKEMPVPHYTIDEAEISFPLSIVSVLGDAGNNIEKNILDAIKLKLPTVLNQTMKQYYINKKKEIQLKMREEKAARQNTPPETANTIQTDDAVIEIEKEIETLYGHAANRITVHIEKKMKTFLSTANLNLIKPLDIKDKFMDILQKEYISEFNNQDTSKHPVQNKETLEEMINSVGTNIFFEFTSPVGKNGILVDACSGRLGEFSIRDNRFNVKLKIREQDLDFVVVGNDDNGSTTRFLSLN